MERIYRYVKLIENMKSSIRKVNLTFYDIIKLERSLKSRLESIKCLYGDVPMDTPRCQVTLNSIFHNTFKYTKLGD